MVPSQLKTAKIIPVYKLGDSSFMDNYHPIAMLDVFSKVMEKLYVMAYVHTLIVITLLVISNLALEAITLLYILCYTL
jgi:hypothetical protein